MTTKKRVKQLMKEEGLDIKNELLVLDMSIIYIRGRADLLIELIKETK